jgi:hypothetical protein
MPGIYVVHEGATGVENNHREKCAMTRTITKLAIVVGVSTAMALT